MPDQPVTPKPLQLSVRKLLMVVGVICIFCALLLPSFRVAQGAKTRSVCQNNLKLIGLARHNYRFVHGSFPPPFSVDTDRPTDRMARASNLYPQATRITR
jgi:type II secretory pathway pseudopilin PulG